MAPVGALPPSVPDPVSQCGITRPVGLALTVPNLGELGRGCVGSWGCILSVSLASAFLLAAFLLQTCFLYTEESMVASTPNCQFLLPHPQRGADFLSLY